jgi:hypothetical protein
MWHNGVHMSASTSPPFATLSLFHWLTHLDLETAVRLLRPYAAPYPRARAPGRRLLAAELVGLFLRRAELAGFFERMQRRRGPMATLALPPEGPARWTHLDLEAIVRHLRPHAAPYPRARAPRRRLC